MKPGDTRRVYYDHEPAYRKIAAQGGRAWDDLHSGVSPGSYEAFQTFLRSAFIPPPGPKVKVLDLGCGGGQAAIMLAEQGYATSGVDYSETAIHLAEFNAREAGLAIHFSVGDCRTLDGFESEVMDLVVDNHVLHCLIGAPDRMAFLRSTYRVLKPGGILFSETMSCEGAFDAMAVGADPTTRISQCHTRYWATQAELNKELEAAGYHLLYQEFRQPEEAAGATVVTYAQRLASATG
jgi:2-polyprenyl-3-methyl-5-hydroxy-6-metoxy-1,4-benzoquinol methylase